MEEELTLAKIPDLELPQLLFSLTLSDDLISAADKESAKAKLLGEIEKNAMLPFYLFICEQLKWEPSQALVSKLKESNDAKLKELDDKIEDAIKNLGENEIREAHLAKAEFFARIGDKDKAIVAFQNTTEKTVALGQKLDIIFSLIRIGFFYNDYDLLNKNIEKGKNLVEEGGDWDRRNRLKVYDALHLMSKRDFAKAANLFLETLSTFTSYELFDYKKFIFYAVLTSIVSLDRVLLKKKVVDAPEILSVILEIPNLSDFLNSLYNSDYKLFFTSLAAISEMMNRDRYLAAHVRYFCRELRIKAYSQMLESYRSVQLSSMALAFGVSTEFLDRELSRFISSGRIHCKIDKVGGIVETNRPDAKNALYQTTIKQGDLLLNRVQKLARVIDV